MSEPIKYTYRGIGGFILALIVLILAIISFIFLFIGIIIVIFSWFPIIFPDFLVTYRIMFLSERILDPTTAFILFFVTGFTLISVGVIVLGTIFYFYRTAQLVDQDLSQTIDFNIPSIKKLYTIKSKAVIVLAIMLFGTFVVILQLFLL